MLRESSGRCESREGGRDAGKWPLKLTELPSVNCSSFDLVGGRVVGRAKMSKA